MNKKNNRLSAQNIFSVIVTIAIVAALAFGVVSVVNTQKKNSNKKDNYINLNEGDYANNTTIASKKQNDVAKNTVISNEIKKTEAQTKEITQKQTLEAKAQENTLAENEQKPVVNNKISSKYIFNDSDTLTWPLIGEVILGYSMDSTIWFPTLAQYKCNSGMVIGATEGSLVTNAASGVVESVVSDNEYGTLISVDIGNGYKLYYGQLDNYLGLEKGSTVIEGQPIGKVAKTTRYYTKEGDNLFFKMTKEDKPVNPYEYLGE